MGHGEATQGSRQVLYYNYTYTAGLRDFGGNAHFRPNATLINRTFHLHLEANRHCNFHILRKTTRIYKYLYIATKKQERERNYVQLFN